MRSPLALALALALALHLTGCVSPPPPAEPAPGAPATPVPLAASSASFEDGAPIPEKHTCDGEEVSPPLTIVGVNATHLALIMDDPDVPLPQAPTRTFTHWVLWNANVSANGTVAFPEGSPPPGATEGANDGGATGYAGPCPPALSPAHRYAFTFFAVDGALDLAEGASRADLEAGLDGRVVDTIKLTGMYARALPPQTYGQ